MTEPVRFYGSVSTVNATRGFAFVDISSIRRADGEIGIRAGLPAEDLFLHVKENRDVEPLLRRGLQITFDVSFSEPRREGLPTVLNAQAIIPGQNSGTIRSNRPVWEIDESPDAWATRYRP